MISLQDFITMIPVGCGIAVGILTAIKKFKGKSPKQKFIETARKNQCMVQAILVDTWIYSGNSRSSNMESRYPTKHALYLYRVNGKKYTKGLRVSLPPGRRYYTFPETKMIYYKKGNPKKALTENEATDSEKLERGCLISIAYAFAVMAALIWIFKWLGLVE